MLLLVSRWHELHSNEVLCFCFDAWHEEEEHSVVETAGFVRVGSWIRPVLWHVLLLHPGFVTSAVWFWMDAFHEALTISVLNTVEMFW